MAESIFGRWTSLETHSRLLHLRTPSSCAPPTHYQHCNSMFKGPPCLVMHIQSCRLKQTAICMPLGEGGWEEWGWEVGCRGKHHSSSRHPAEYSLSGASNVSVFPHTVTVRASRSQSNHSNQGLVVPNRLESGCQNKR